MTIRELAANELHLARDIDVSEEGEIVYSYAGGLLTERHEEWKRPRWSAEQWDKKIEQFKTDLHYDIMFGAFDGERMVGLASLRYRVEDDDAPPGSTTTAQLTSLHVSREARGRGVASALLGEVIRRARESGAAGLYVSATPSASAVGCYLAHGFCPTDRVIKRLFDLEPEDIHMRNSLRRWSGVGGSA